MTYEKDDGRKYMYLAGCPHKKRPFNVEGVKVVNDNIICPFHHAIFNLITGELVKEPESKTPCINCRLIKVEVIEGRLVFHGKPFIPELPKR